VYTPRQAAKDFSLTRLTIIILLICVTVPFSVFTFRSGLQYALLTRNAQIAEGFVTMLDRKPAGWHIGYQFVDPDGLPHEGIFVDTGGTAVARLGLKQGDPVEVLFFPPAPSIFQLASELPRQRFDWYALLTATIMQFAFIAMLILSYRSHLIQKERDRFY